MAAPSTKPAKDLSPKPVYYLGVFRTASGQPAVELVADTDLSSIGFMSKGFYRDGIAFSSKTVADQSKAGDRKTIQEKAGQVNYYHTSFGFCAVIITDPAYDRMTAQAFLSKVVDAFKSQFTPTEIRDKAPPFQWPQIAALRKEAVTAEGSDSIAAVQKELDETKIVLHQTIQSVLERGETLDNLVAKSDELSYMSKGFYKQAKQQNSCCVVM